MRLLYKHSTLVIHIRIDSMARNFSRLYKFNFMSSAFVKESDDQWLQDIAPTMNALINFLTRENNGIPVREEKTFYDDSGRQVFSMSNGLLYYKDDNGRWQVK